MKIAAASVFLLVAVMLCSLSFAQQVKAPIGWADTRTPTGRVVSNGNATVSIGPWLSLRGSEPDEWLSERATTQPHEGEVISIEPVKRESVEGAYSVTRKARFAEAEGYSILYWCPGQTGHGRLLTLDVHNGSFLDTARGALFGEKVCRKEPKGQEEGSVNASSTSASNSSNISPDSTQGNYEPAPATDLSFNDGQPLVSDDKLRERNRLIPDSHRPVSASMFTESYWSGFPAMLMHRVGMALTFQGGENLACADWDPANGPSPSSLVSEKDCQLPGQSVDKPVHGFKPGHRLNLSFGHINAAGIDGIDTSASSIRGGTLVLSDEGRILIDTWQIGHMSTSAASARATSGNSNTVIGQYYLDGHTITVLSVDGRTLHGFIGYTVDDSEAIEAIFLNGRHYWNQNE